MKAVIMAGGDGKRLRPITCTMPKPLVPLLNKPTIFYSLDLLKKHGIKDAVITLGYMGDAIREAVGTGERWGMNVTYSDPEKRLGTAGSVRCAVSGDDEPIIVLSGDGLTDIDITDVLKAHEASGAAATLALYPVAEPTEFGIVVTDRDGFITKFVEKPSEGEVFSDRANTGIYILSDEALNAIPENEEYDFSKDLFPKLMAEGKRLFGYSMRGYWCDAGDIAALKRAQADMLDGHCEFNSDAENNGGVLIEKGALISNEAELIPPCYIGRNAEIGSRVRVEPYSVVCTGAKLMEGVSVKRSVIFENAVIRRFSELRGAIVCENADVDARSLLLEGAVIGAGSRLGRNVTVAQSILIWPDKYIERATKCDRNIIWGENRFLDSDEAAFTGLADRELTPENVLKLASAFASGLSRTCGVLVATDGSSPSVMLKQAAISGILSQGMDAVSTDAVSRSAFGYMIENAGLSGGIYIECDAFERRVTMTLFGENGVELPPEKVRSIMKKLSSGEVRPTTASEIGLIRSVGSMGMEYEAGLIRLFNEEHISGEGRKLIINAPVQTANTAARVMLRLGWTVDTVSEIKKLIPTYNADAISVLIDKNERVSCFLAGVGAVDRNRAYTVLALCLGRERVIVPSELDGELIRHLEERRIETVTAPDDAARMRITAKQNGLYTPELLEPEAATVRLCALFASGRLKRELDALPSFTRRESELPVSKCDFGRMLRSVIETEYERVGDMVDGVKLRLDSGWVTVRPCRERSTFRIVAGSRDAEYAKELCDVYSEKLRKLNLDGNKT